LINAHAAPCHRLEEAVPGSAVPSGHELASVVNERQADSRHRREEDGTFWTDTW
jgi:hypothetical protein